MSTIQRTIFYSKNHKNSTYLTFAPELSSLTLAKSANLEFIWTPVTSLSSHPFPDEGEGIEKSVSNNGKLDGLSNISSFSDFRELLQVGQDRVPARKTDKTHSLQNLK